ncbi:hypothetical protein LDG_7619 [Legionella drancourtii LLAP12]|uniref:Uncharacterized protein n=1 Tax=Legionella drancourtii LLAP12 TaxID=658187 RepID=G9EQR7_9GAMM|nr:hypothetical protein LDG_7619 [Legionella drancourtii LLAP12]
MPDQYGVCRCNLKEINTAANAANAVLNAALFSTVRGQSTPLTYK